LFGHAASFKMQSLASGKFDRDFLFHIFLISFSEPWAGILRVAGVGEWKEQKGAESIFAASDLMYADPAASRDGRCPEQSMLFRFSSLARRRPGLCLLFANAQSANHDPVTFRIVGLQVIQQAAALADEH
jgi:hypothetical protein